MVTKEMASNIKPMRAQVDTEIEVIKLGQSKVEKLLKMLGDKPKVRIIRMRKVPFMDSTGIHNLESLIRMSQKDKTKILLSGVNEQVHKALEKAGIQEKLGAENICDNINAAIIRAEEIVSKK